jgi:hypothetical protein
LQINILIWYNIIIVNEVNFMMKPYHKPRAFTFKDAVRKNLRGYAAQAKAEQYIGSIDSEIANVAKTMRARLVAEYPSASDADIDTMLKLIMSAGLRQTSDRFPEPRGIPKDVQSVRRAERRACVRKGRPSRK